MVHGGLIWTAHHVDVWRADRTAFKEQTPSFESELVFIIPTMVEVPVKKGVVVPPKPPPEPPPEIVEPVVIPEVALPDTEPTITLEQEPIPVVEPIQEVIVEEEPPKPVEETVAINDPSPPSDPVEAETADLTSYWEEVRSSVARKLRYPRSAGYARRSDQTVYVRLVIAASGALVEVEVIPPKADAALSRAAIRAVKLAAPFNAPKTNGEQITAELPIVFRVN
jgi:TonB family protein